MSRRMLVVVSQSRNVIPICIVLRLWLTWTVQRIAWSRRRSGWERWTRRICGSRIDFIFGIGVVAIDLDAVRIFPVFVVAINGFPFITFPGSLGRYHVRCIQIGSAGRPTKIRKISIKCCSITYTVRLGHLRPLSSDPLGLFSSPDISLELRPLCRLGSCTKLPQSQPIDDILFTLPAALFAAPPSP
jgi:hypothetical protein